MSTNPLHLLSWRGEEGRRLDAKFSKVSCKRKATEPAAVSARLRFADGSTPTVAKVNEREFERRHADQQNKMRKAKQEVQNDERRTKALRQKREVLAAQCARETAQLESIACEARPDEVERFVNLWATHLHPDICSNLPECRCKEEAQSCLRELRLRITGEGPFAGACVANTNGWSSAEAKQLGARWDQANQTHCAPSFSELCALTHARLVPPSSVDPEYYRPGRPTPIWTIRGLPHPFAMADFVKEEVLCLRDLRAGLSKEDIIALRASKAATTTDVVQPSTAAIEKTPWQSANKEPSNKESATKSIERGRSRGGLQNNRPVDSNENLRLIWNEAHIPQACVQMLDRLGEVLGPRDGRSAATRVLAGLRFDLLDPEHLRAEWDFVTAGGLQEEDVQSSLRRILERASNRHKLASRDNWRRHVELSAHLDASPLSGT